MKRDSAVKTYMKAVIILIVIIVIINLIYRRTRFYYYRPFYIPFNQRLNTENVILTSGETFTLKLMNVNKRVTFRSSDFKVALVLFTGKIYARNAGTAVIYVSFEDKVSRCLVHVIELNHKKVKVEVGEQERLEVEGTTKAPDWVSYNERIATVDGNGILTGKREGITVIAAKVHGKLLRCKVQVKNKKQNINK